MLMQRVEKALAARLDTLVVLESLRRQEGIINASFQELLAKELSGTMRNADVHRMNRIRSEVDQVQQAKLAAEKAYGLLRDRNERDIALYFQQRSRDFTAIVAKFAESQAALHNSIADVWLSMARKAGAEVGDLREDLADVDMADLVRCSVPAADRWWKAVHLRSVC
jgi:type VI protein secretion system component VasK